LKKIEKEVKKVNPKIETKLVSLDFNESTEVSYYQRVCDEVKDLDVSILINNAGVMPLAKYLDQDPSIINEMTDVNIHGPAMLTSILGKRMKDRKQRSAIINVASIAAYNPLKYFNHYSGTKAWLNFFTLALKETRQ
jgi:short-subunit dehydrogenase